MSAQSVRKTVPPGLIVCMFAILLAHTLLCATPPASAEKNKLKDIEQAGELVLCVCHEDFPPFSFYSGEGWVGYDIDLAKALAKEMGVRLRIVTDPDWEGVIDMVRNGRADIGMSSLSISPDRVRNVSFSRPYMSMRQGVLANQLTLAKLPGDTPEAKLNTPQAIIAVRYGSIYRQLLPRLVPNAAIKEFHTWEECYDAVKHGTATGIIGDESQLFTWMGRNKGDSMRLVPVLFNGKQDPIAIAIAKENRDLAEYINAFLLNYQPQAMGIQEAYWKYRGEDDTPHDESAAQKIPANEYPVLIIAIAAAALLAASLIFAARK